MTAKRSLSVCTSPKLDQLELSNNSAEKQQATRTESMDSFLRDLALELDVLGHENGESDERIETRILASLRELKCDSEKLVEERDLLKNNSYQLENKLGEVLKGNRIIGSIRIEFI